MRLESVADNFLTNISTKEKQKGIMINLAWHISSEIKDYVRKKLKYKGRIIDLISKSDFK